MTTEPSYVDYYDPRKKVVYIAGPYTADTPEGIDANIRKAERIAWVLWRDGIAVITPHLNTVHFEETYADRDKAARVFYGGDLSILKRCDAVLMLPNWGKSTGAMMEHEAALAWDIPVFYSVATLHDWVRQSGGTR